jgi:hypothetical protein
MMKNGSKSVGFAAVDLFLQFLQKFGALFGA